MSWQNVAMLTDLPQYICGQEYDVHEFLLFVMSKLSFDARYVKQLRDSCAVMH